MIGLILDKFFSLLYLHDKRGHITVYPAATTLVKKGHIPLVAYRILKGSVEVYDGDQFVGEYGSHTCWGMNEIMNERPSLYTVWVKKGTTVCMIGKSELQKTWMKMLHLFESDMLEKISKERPDFNY